jgi:hypothetical protein
MSSEATFSSRSDSPRARHGNLVTDLWDDVVVGVGVRRTARLDSRDLSDQRGVSCCVVA